MLRCGEESRGVGCEQVTPPQADVLKRRQRRPFRKDIEGLRAVAILAVVLYHAHLGAVPGGYVGVDVFFVISGYLITDHLWREVNERRQLSFSNFYARRIRRLLPASFLVLAVTAVASAAILPPLTARLRRASFWPFRVRNSQWPDQLREQLLLLP